MPHTNGPIDVGSRVVPVPRNPKLTLRLKQRVVEDYQAGLTVSKIGERHKVSRATVYWILKQQDIKPNRHAGATAAEPASADLTARLERLERSTENLNREFGRLQGTVDELRQRLETSINVRLEMQREMAAMQERMTMLQQRGDNAQWLIAELVTQTSDVPVNRLAERFRDVIREAGRRAIFNRSA